MQRKRTAEQTEEGSSTTVVHPKRSQTLRLSTSPVVEKLRSRTCVPPDWSSKLNDENPLIRCRAIVNIRAYLENANKGEVNECVNFLLDQLKRENKSNIVIALITLLGDLSKNSHVNHQSVFDALVSYYYERRKKNHKPISCLLYSGQKLITELSMYSDAASLIEELSEVCYQTLLCKDVHAISRALLTLSTLHPINHGTKGRNVQQVMIEYSRANDSRVRTAALRSIAKLHERGESLDLDLYDGLLETLDDGYESVRQEALHLLWVLSNLHPQILIKTKSTSSSLYEETEEVKLIDHTFGRICNMVNDPSYKIRVFALKLLASMKGVGAEMMLQTLDKKVMSHLRKKKSAHEERQEATGINPEGDTEFNPEDISIMDSGACGALVLGLEDEHSEVRSSSIDCLCMMSQDNNDFGRRGIDFLVDMFNDEIDEVRMNAILSLGKMGDMIEYSVEQLDIILSVLGEENMLIRHACQRFIGNMKVGSIEGLKLIMKALFSNLSQFSKHDLKSIWKTVSKLGKNHPSFVQFLTEPFLGIEPLFISTEPNVDDQLYITKLILVFNAAPYNRTICSLFSSHNFAHFDYLKDKYPTYFPVDFKIDHFDILQDSNQDDKLMTTEEGNEEEFQLFLKQVNNRLLIGLNDLKINNFSQAQIIWTQTLNNLSQAKKSFPKKNTQSDFYKCQINCFSHFTRIKECFQRSQLTKGDQTVLELAKSLVYCTRQLESLYYGLSDFDTVMISNFRLMALLLTLLLDNKIEHREQHLLMLKRQIQKNLSELPNESKSFTEIFREIVNLIGTAPVIDNISSHLISQVQEFCPSMISSSDKLKKPVCNLTVEALDSQSTTYPSGLPLALTLHGIFFDLINPSSLRIQIELPDGTLMLVASKPCHFTLISEFNYKYKQTLRLALSPSTGVCNISVRPIIKYRDSSIDINDGDVCIAGTNEESERVALGFVSFSPNVALELHPEIPSHQGMLRGSIFGDKS